MAYDFARIQNDLIINQIVNSLMCGVERKMEELHEKESSPYIHGINGLANYLGIGKTLAQEIKNERKITPYQDGRNVWFKKAEVNKYVESNKN
jgi:excisionase family DNA binding protein